MNALLLMVLLTSAGSEQLEWVRSTDGGVEGRAALAVPLAASRIESATMFRSTLGRTLGSERRGATLLDLVMTTALSESVTIGFEVPNVLDSDAPTGNGHFGNLGFSGTVTMLSSPAYRLAVRTSLHVPTGADDGIHALAFASDLRRLAPSTTTLAGAVQLEAEVWRGVFATTVGADLFLYGDPSPLRLNPVNGGLWVDGFFAVPFEFDDAKLWTLHLAPVAEFRGRSTVTWRGTSTELVVGGGLTVATRQRDHSASADSSTHAAVGIGVYLPVLESGPGSVEASARFLMTMSIAYDFREAVFVPNGGSS